MVFLHISNAATTSFNPGVDNNVIHLVFLLFRSFACMKYNLPLRAPDIWDDLWRPAAAYAMPAPLLAILGLAIGFIPPPHTRTASPRAMTAAFGLIFLGTALPEEILFRSLIQNLLMSRNSPPRMKHRTHPGH
jgi:membrane protease YdiL (CAAX protease family)